MKDNEQRTWPRQHLYHNALPGGAAGAAREAGSRLPHRDHPRSLPPAEPAWLWGLPCHVPSTGTCQGWEAAPCRRAVSRSRLWRSQSQIRMAEGVRTGPEAGGAGQAWAPWGPGDLQDLHVDGVPLGQSHFVGLGTQRWFRPTSRCSRRGGLGGGQWASQFGDRAVLHVSARHTAQQPWGQTCIWCSACNTRR